MVSALKEANAMRPWRFAVGSVAVLLWANVWYTGATSPVSHAPSTMVELPGEGLNRLADDRDANRSDRAAAVFALFKEHIKPGDGLWQMQRVLRNTDWVDEAKLYYFAIFGGFIPVDCTFEDRTYSLHLFADNEGQSEWVIYFQLAGKSEFGKWYEDGVAFLRGKPGSCGGSVIKEFALCYPNGKTEIHTLR
jgi:hypothetical protein